jgi:hypothetical protein
MNLLAQLRRSPRLIRSVFAVFVLAWLQTALLPCAMASVVTESMPEMVMVYDSMDSMDMDGMDMAGMSEEAAHHDCVYCPPLAADQDQHSTTNNCAYLHAPQADGGNTQQHAQLVFHAALIHVTANYYFPTMSAAFALPTRHTRIPIAQRPLNLTHCKQLK